MMLITLEQFRRAMNLEADKADPWFPWLQLVITEWRVNTPDRMAGFLAQIAHESDRLQRLVENLNYSAQGLANTWPTRYAVDPKARPRVPNALAVALHRKPEKIANHTYANRFGNGDVASGDGWKYRGRCPIQLTFSDNYKACEDAILQPVHQEPDLLIEPEYGMQASGWYWDSHKCNQFMDIGDWEGCTKAINGGLIGYEDGDDVGLNDRVEWLQHTMFVLRN